MSTNRSRPRTGGQAFTLGDPRIWAEIYYLDSATDYREFLPTGNPLAEGFGELLTTGAEPLSCISVMKLLLHLPWARHFRA